MQTIPCIMSGRDIVGTAETGSGKTLAYLLPLMKFLQNKIPANPGTFIFYFYHNN
jgi:superfamily II DNA/RNA helicase